LLEILSGRGILPPSLSFLQKTVIGDQPFLVCIGLPIGHVQFVRTLAISPPMDDGGRPPFKKEVPLAPASFALSIPSTALNLTLARLNEAGQVLLLLLPVFPPSPPNLMHRRIRLSKRIVGLCPLSPFIKHTSPKGFPIAMIVSIPSIALLNPFMPFLTPFLPRH